MNKMIFIPALFLPAIASATPAVFPKFPDTLAKVIPVEGVSIVGDNKSPNIFYVTPPTSGIVTASNLSLRNANLGFCTTIASLRTSADHIVEQLSRVEASYSNVHAEAMRLEQSYREAQAQADSLRTSSDTLIRISELDSKVSDDQNRLDQLYQQLNNCRYNCRSINNEIVSTQNDLRSMQQSRQEIAKSHLYEVQRYERAVSAANSAKGFWQDKNNEVIEEEKQIKDLSSLHSEIYGQYAKLEGGYVHIDYNSQWDEKVKELIEKNRKQNPGFAFQKMDTHDVTVHAVIGPTNTASYLESSPAVLSYSVAGQSGDGLIKLNSLPSRLSVDLRLSIVGACPIAFPDLFKINGKQDPIAFGISADYNYYSAFNSHARFWVNEKQFYQKVMNAGSSGFLFWKHSWQTMDITQISNDAYHFDWELADPQNQVSLADRRATEAQAVTFILSRLISKYSTGTVNVDPLPVPNSGLSEVGKGLLSLCGASSPLCTAGGFIMMGLDQIIAGGESTSSGVHRFDASGEIEWNDSVLQSVPASTVFGVLPPTSLITTSKKGAHS